MLTCPVISGEGEIDDNLLRAIMNLKDIKQKMLYNFNIINTKKFK